MTPEKKQALERARALASLLSSIFFVSSVVVCTVDLKKTQQIISGLVLRRVYSHYLFYY